MDQLWRFLDGGPVRNGSFTPESALLSLLLAFVLGQVLAWVYFGTHSGLSYSRTFVQSLILITVVVAVVMAVIGNSLVTAFGLMGALGIIRFRNMLKDTRDITFIFCALVIGMAAGSQRYAIAIIGTLCFCSIVIYLHLIAFGSHRSQNTFLRFSLSGSLGADHPLPAALKRYCSAFSLVSMQDSPHLERAEYAYQLKLCNDSQSEEFLSSLEDIAGISNISLTKQEELLEV